MAKAAEQNSRRNFHQSLINQTTGLMDGMIYGYSWKEGRKEGTFPELSWFQLLSFTGEKKKKAGGM